MKVAVVSKRARAKKVLLDVLTQILFKDDDLFPDELPCEGPEYEAFDEARNELVREFERRGS